MFVNISAYKFVELDNLEERRRELLQFCNQLHLKGTILLSGEGINVFVAGSREAIDSIVRFFESRPEYSGLPIKESPSEDQPFSRMLVRIKKEIIAFGVHGINPARRASPKLNPVDLKQWLDEGREVTLLDVRNDYEVELGTFHSAQAIGIDHFRKFPDAVKQLPQSLKERPLVMFCTGGIRCEKAGPFMEQAGFEHVYQLDGGILNYFEQCGGDHYDGECFVFDKRVAVDPKLNETSTEQCYACQHPLTVDDQQSPGYVVGKSCPYCYCKPADGMRLRIDARNEQIRAYCSPLPGSLPYDNHRPMNVPLRFDKTPVARFLADYHPHVDGDYWRNEIEQGRILYKDHPVDPELQVWAGQRLVHLLQGTVEPDVDCNIRLLYEDDWMVVLDKPAPLAMHPCGRFNRNTLSFIMNAVYRGEKIRMTHRLDANTSGIVVMARRNLAAQKIQAQFENGSVRKTYIARVSGVPDSQEFSCELPISKEPGESGLRAIDPDGLPALTEFRNVRPLADGTSLVECSPKTGRTNQIRLHLWSLGFPIVNDPSYLPGGRTGVNQTLPLGAPRMCLHARKLEFRHPQTAEVMEFQSDCPDWAG